MCPIQDSIWQPKLSHALNSTPNYMSVLLYADTVHVCLAEEENSCVGKRE